LERFVNIPVPEIPFEAFERIVGLNIDLDLLRAFSPAADKLGKSLGEFETYIRNNIAFHSELRGTLPAGRNAMPNTDLLQFGGCFERFYSVGVGENREM
jgi:hypothetical protein